MHVVCTHACTSHQLVIFKDVFLSQRVIRSAGNRREKHFHFSFTNICVKPLTKAKLYLVMEVNKTSMTVCIYIYRFQWSRVPPYMVMAVYTENV